MINGILTISTNRPATIARPPKISTSITTQAVALGAGVPTT
jgi:hypothetical protein